MKLEGNFSNIVEFENIFQGPNYERLKKTLLSTMLRQKDKVFANSKDPDGNAWAPLSKKAAARRTAKAVKAGAKDPTNHKILVDTAMLRNSVTDASAPYGLRSIENDEVVVGTNVPYANIHQYGGTIVHAHETLREVKWSNKPEFMKVYGVSVIPARPYIGFGNDDQEQVNEITNHYLKTNGGANE